MAKKEAMKKNQKNFDSKAQASQRLIEDFKMTDQETEEQKHIEIS